MVVLVEESQVSKDREQRERMLVNDFDEREISSKGRKKNSSGFKAQTKVKLKQQKETFLASKMAPHLHTITT